jgi:uncharacterized membrane protein YphA (DoxX/SURF4 family)
MDRLKLLEPLAARALRVALALSFLSAVADRFGLWGPPGAPNVAWGTFNSFIEYTALLLWFLPAGLVTIAGWVATILEVVLAIGLLSGFYLRWFALASAALLMLFALSMAVALGIEPAFSYSVWTASAAAFLLACIAPADSSESK